MYSKGIYDAIITSSDEEAIEFYQNHDFNENPILNCKYNSIGDVWTNTTKMCYIPPYLTDNSILLSTYYFMIFVIIEFLRQCKVLDHYVSNGSHYKKILTAQIYIE